jgi:hypothetical protein
MGTAAGGEEPRILFYIPAAASQRERQRPIRLSSRLGLQRVPRAGGGLSLGAGEPFPAALEDCVAGYRWLITAGGAAPQWFLPATRWRQSHGRDAARASRTAMSCQPQACVSPIFDLALTGGSVTAEPSTIRVRLSLQKCSTGLLATPITNR